MQTAIPSLRSQSLNGWTTPRPLGPSGCWMGVAPWTRSANACKSREFRRLQAAGWELTDEVLDDYGFMEKRST